MPSRPYGPVRRAQLVAPFGPGAMITVPGGTSLIIGGLDYWYQRSDPLKPEVDTNEFKRSEWRLETRLNVGHFRLPPDFRVPWRFGQEVPNSRLTIPAFRFPRYHFCPDCKRLEKRGMYERGLYGRIKCPECEDKKKTRHMFQVPFIAMCPRGHIQDFPWREWVHHSITPPCKGVMRLIPTGSASLGGQTVKCDDCDEQRTLAGITHVSIDGNTTLSSTLSEGDVYLCQGQRPWLGPDANQGCKSHIKGSLRSAANVYYAQVRSAIYLPQADDIDLQEIIYLLENHPISSLLSLLSGLNSESSTIIEALRLEHGPRFSKFEDEQIERAVEIVSSDRTGQSMSTVEESDRDEAPEEHHFRKSEFDVMRKPQKGAYLHIRSSSNSAYRPEVERYFSRILLIDKLRETRALAGFTRIFPDSGQTIEDLKNTLWLNPSADRSKSWLPAYTVFGEGLFFEFQQEMLTEWELRSSSIARCQPLFDRHDKAQKARGLIRTQVTPRLVLIHTFSHILINELVFECGYSSASLRERLYVSDIPGTEMAGLLIYTADGDSDGTMGGLVRMGKPGLLEPVIEKALRGAAWCSADPVCMEVGRHHGQGPDLCNLAACHNCALLPETACEMFNRFLDRGVVISSPENPQLGFFSQFAGS